MSKIAKVYTYDTNPWRYAEVLDEYRCSHTGDSFVTGDKKTYPTERIKFHGMIETSPEFFELLEVLK